MRSIFFYGYCCLTSVILVLCSSGIQIFAQKKLLSPARNSANSPVRTSVGTVSVRDFGALGDGLTNDTYAIQQAVNSGAGAVYFPSTPHGYKIETVIVNRPITIYGDNKQGTTITPFKSNISLFISYSTFVTFRQLYFVTYKGITQYDTAIQLRGSINTIDDCFFSGMEVGIYNDSYYKPDEQYIKNCRFRDCSYGITSDGYFRNTRISDYCIFHACKCAINLYDNNDNIHTTEGVVIENSMIYDSGDSLLNKAAVNIENVDFSFIRNCMIDQNRNAALSIKESRWCDFSGTYFSSVHSSNASAVKIIGDCSDLFMLNCRIGDSHNWGIELQGNKRNPSNITISDCWVRFNPAGDILINGATNVRISKSSFYTDVPTSIAAIGNDGVTSVYVSECFIKGGIYKGVEKVEMTLKDCPQKPTQKTGLVTIAAGKSQISLPNDLTVLYGQSVVLEIIDVDKSGANLSTQVTGNKIVFLRTGNIDTDVRIRYKAEVL